MSDECIIGATSMRLQSAIRSLLVFSLIFAVTTPVFANSLANWVLVWPGAVSIDPVFGLLPTVLAAFIERPFVSRAGVGKRPLLQSIRANLLSLLAGIPIAAFIWSVESLQGMIVLTGVAVIISILVEGSYLSAVLNGEPQQLRWSWIALGNIVSNSVLIGIALVVKTLNTTHPELGEAIAPHYSMLMLLHVAISLTAVAAALGQPLLGLPWAMLRLPRAVLMGIRELVRNPAEARRAADELVRAKGYNRPKHL